MELLPASLDDYDRIALNAGAPVSLGWADDAAAIIQTWFGGQDWRMPFST